MKLKVGDPIIVLAGREKGKSGKVKTILKTSNKVIIEGLNICTKHQKPKTRDESGILTQKEKPIHISNIMLCDLSGSPTKFRIVKEGKNKFRVSKKTGDKIT